MREGARFPLPDALLCPVRTGRLPCKAHEIQRIMDSKQEEESRMEKEIAAVVRQLGVTSRYKGYFYLIGAIEMTGGSEHLGYRITKDVYPLLARRYSTTVTSVEHDIRTIVRYCWRKQRNVLDHMAGYTLTEQPSNREFIDILGYYLRNQGSSV